MKRNRNLLTRRAWIGAGGAALVFPLASPAQESAAAARVSLPGAKITAVKAIYTGFVYIKIETDAGVFGIGDGSCSGRSAAVIETVKKHFGPALIGRDPTRIEFIWQDVFRGNMFSGPIMQSALSGIDMALWDLFGKLAGLPVYRLLGGACRDRVMVYVHVYGNTVDELAAAARNAVAKGYRVIRIAPPELPVMDAPKIIRQSVERMAALRQALGDDIEIAFDAHTRFTPQQGIELCERLAPHRPYFVEDPVRSESMATYRLIRSHTKVPLAAGEQLSDMWQFRQLIDENLVDYLRVEVSCSGGISQARKIAAMAEAHYQELVTHYTGSPVNTAACLHLNMFIPNCASQEYREPGGQMIEITPGALVARDGFLQPTDAPGLGLEFNEAAALALEKRIMANPQHTLRNLRRPDGSISNW